MGWLWGSGNSPNGQDELDPSLRDFLKKEAPTGPKPALPSTPREKPTDYSTPTEPQTQSQTQTQSEKPFVPPQSQFQDGRYAHLWKNYTPQDVLNDRGKTEQDRLRDLVDAYNDRRASVGRTAMENCALEYMEQFDCFRHPKTWVSMGTLCNAESRRFYRCYEVQSKFLKALGYMTMDARSPAEDERIQMHADKLYQQMMQQEAEIAKAKEEGRPEPKFESVLSKRNVVQILGESAADTSDTSNQDKDYEEDIWRHIKPDSRKAYEKKLSELPPDQQDVERMAMLGELKAQTGVAKQAEETFMEERINRLKRKEAGQATLGDTIKSWWGWG